VDLGKLLRPNPFSDDDGSIQPAMAAALAIPRPGERLEAMVAALTLGRVFVPVVAHAHPGVDGDGAVQAHDGSQPDEAALVEASKSLVSAPGGLQAVPVFSRLASMSEFAPAARPMPVLGRNAAAQALLEIGILALDPVAPEKGWFFGRSAVAAMAAAEPWIAPWNDPELIRHLRDSVSGPHIGGIALEPLANGTVRIQLHVKKTAGRTDVEAAIARLGAVVKLEPYVRARLDMIEILPVRLA